MKLFVAFGVEGEARIVINTDLVKCAMDKVVWLLYHLLHHALGVEGEARIVINTDLVQHVGVVAGHIVCNINRGSLHLRNSITIATTPPIRPPALAPIRCVRCSSPIFV